MQVSKWGAATSTRARGRLTLQKSLRVIGWWSYVPTSTQRPWTPLISAKTEGKAASTFDISPDVQHFVVVEDGEDENATPPAVQITQNWYEEFRDREQD